MKTNILKLVKPLFISLGILSSLGVLYVGILILNVKDIEDKYRPIIKEQALESLSGLSSKSVVENYLKKKMTSCIYSSYKHSRHRYKFTEFKYYPDTIPENDIFTWKEGVIRDCAENHIYSAGTYDDAIKRYELLSKQEIYSNNDYLALIASRN